MAVPPGIGPIANSGEGGFDKNRIGRADGNRSIQYAGARFTVTPMTAARAAEAEVKFAQGAKPGKGGQLPGKKVSPRIAQQRGCEPGYELVSPPVNHNLYSIEDVKLMVESWRHLNPDVRAALKFVATHGVEMACMGGVNAGANRLHLSDGCGGTGAAKRVDQKHGGVPVAAVLPAVQDMLVEEGVRERVELSVDGGVLTGEHALKLMLLGADRVGFGTSVLMSIGCSMLRQCHMAGPQPGDTTGKRRQGCTLGVATQDPALVARFTGKSRHVTRLLQHVAHEVRELMAANGIRRLADVVGRRDLLEKRSDLDGQGGAPRRRPHRGRAARARARARRRRAAPALRAAAARGGGGRRAARARRRGGRAQGRAHERRPLRRRGRGRHRGAPLRRRRAPEGPARLPPPRRGRALLRGLRRLRHGAVPAGARGRLVASRPPTAASWWWCPRAATRASRSSATPSATARAPAAPTSPAAAATASASACARATRATGPRVVVEGVEANAFQYMTGGVALVLGTVGFNLGAGLTGGRVYLLDPDGSRLNRQYVKAEPLDAGGAAEVEELLREHAAETASPTAERLLRAFDPARFARVTTALAPEPIE